MKGFVSKVKMSNRTRLLPPRPRRMGPLILPKLQPGVQSDVSRSEPFQRFPGALWRKQVTHNGLPLKRVFPSLKPKLKRLCKKTKLVMVRQAQDYRTRSEATAHPRTVTFLSCVQSLRSWFCNVRWSPVTLPPVLTQSLKLGENEKLSVHTVATAGCVLIPRIS